MTCAHAVRVALQKFPGVASIDVSLNQGSATVKLKPGNLIRPAQFWDAIRKNGNTPKTTRVDVRGAILPGGHQINVTGSREIFDLKSPPQLADRLASASAKAVTIEGTLTP